MRTSSSACSQQRHSGFHTMSEREISADLAIIGGGLGGVAAALTATSLGRKVILTEETDWLGGQMTSQAVPPDEHPWIETHSSASYRVLRNRIRDYYRRAYPLKPGVASAPLLNPGLGFVSDLCHEPRVGVAAIEELLAPARASGLLTVLLDHSPTAVEMDSDNVASVTVTGSDGDRVHIRAPYFVDATELGDLLELGQIEHVLGAESREETGEPNAAAEADPRNQQAPSWCFALEYRPGETHTIDKPKRFEHWRDHQDSFWPGSQLSWTDLDPQTLEPRTRQIFDGDPADDSQKDLWRYRRILAKKQFGPTFLGNDVTLVNWPQTDYWEEPLINNDAGADAAARANARELSLSFLYWMQTEAPRHDDGHGYPGLRLRPDLMGTPDGLAKAIYVREARRIKAEFTVLEQHIGVEATAGRGSALFHDTVGIGGYRIDLHPTASGASYIDIACHPFQIPLGALLPQRVQNLLAANKNIGTTHITNGAYRLHPVEWSIGEAVGALVAFCLTDRKPPSQVRSESESLADFQHLLSTRLQIPLAWPDDVRRRNTR
ncbi:FAD-dependent oxidoreductase [Arthrobacter sp. B2a2-09]|uniref:FAD-dependent oxidoreductase n=1 Tax=Arthrobacter sp. B2a2-09 TaxID=2952822 RepID=UPI0022CD916F|nr:FAD-dependent oxidoreductase [Arthrobacter sp. B2a2-09]MCZ9883300.1 FAD-dependent oxidoreductase [Arthrobacter sp. B2a2-09]